jgi:hypothetical protein
MLLTERSLRPHRRFAASVAVAAMLGALAAFPGAAGAVTSPAKEIGPADELANPSCPEGPCLAVSRTTGYQVRVANRRGGWVVPEDGRIVAFTIKLGRPNQEQIDFFNESLGGVAQARLSALRPRMSRGNPHPIYLRLAQQTPVFRLDRYFGQTVTFPLTESMPVRKGYVLALTVPTWAPALAVGLDRQTSWRANRKKANDGCDNVSTQTAIQTRNTLGEFECMYGTAELTFSATFIPNPKPNAPSRNNNRNSNRNANQSGSRTAL